MIPIKIHAMIIPAGPPLCNADPEPTNKPVPILPPIDNEQGNLRKDNRVTYQLRSSEDAEASFSVVT